MNMPGIQGSTPSNLTPMSAPAVESTTGQGALVPATQVGVAQNGLGALAGAQISVGSGSAAPQPAAIEDLPPVVQSAAQGVPLQPAAARQALFARPAARPQPTTQIAALYVPRPGGVATNAQVLQTLHAQEKAAGTNLSPREITAYVALGEQAFHAISLVPTGVGKRLGAVVVETVNPPVVLTPNLEVSRALAWYVAACAVHQGQQHAADGKAGEEGLPSKAGSVFQDPHNAVYQFLQDSPLAYSRVSPHGGGSSASGGQLGIEDYDRRLPGKSGAIVFGKQQGTMLLRLERSGRPELSTSAQRVDDLGQGRASGWRALLRLIQNSLDYVLGRLPGAQETGRPVDLRPSSAHLDKVHGDCVALEGRAAKAQGVLTPYAPENTSGTHTIPAGVYAEAPKDWNRNGIAINGTAYPGTGRPGHIPSHANGQPSTLEQACSAFVQACGDNPVAADWISRFVHQGLNKPILDYLAMESLGTVGAGQMVIGGTQSYAVHSLPGGAVEVTIDYLYQNSADEPKPLLDSLNSGIVQMDAQARLQASVTLRFDDLDSYTPDKAPVPVISKPLTYTTSEFHQA